MHMCTYCRIKLIIVHGSVKVAHSLLGKKNAPEVMRYTVLQEMYMNVWGWQGVRGAPLIESALKLIRMQSRIR